MRRKLLIFTLCASMVLGATACGKETSQAKGTPVEIEAGDCYTFNDVKDEDVDSTWTFESDNEDVAFVRGGKYICAKAAGTANITVNKGDETEVYTVTVTDAENESDKLLKVTDVKDENIYLGAGYNAFESDEYITNKQLIMGNGTIIKSDILKEEYDDDDTLFRREKADVDEYMYIQGDSSEQYDNNYATTIDGALKVNVKDIVSGNVSGKFVDSAKENENKQKLYTTIFSYNQKYIYILNATDDQLRAMAKQNKKAWKMLTGVNDDSPADVFEKYGTHIITQAVIGGRLELDYTITSNNSSTTKEDFLNIAGGLDLKISAVKGSAQASYNDDKLKELKKQDCTITTSVRVYGGDVTGASVITDLESFATAYPAWYDSINDDTLTFIGTTQYGLLPIWDLLPDDEAGIARKNELKKYYKDHMNELSKKKK